MHEKAKQKTNTEFYPTKVIPQKGYPTNKKLSPEVRALCDTNISQAIICNYNSKLRSRARCAD
jgi:hypothetical protein